MTTVSWSPRALREFRAAVADVGDRDPAAARRLAGRVASQIALLTQFPDIGTPLPEGHRKLSVTGYPYMIRYRVTAQRVEIVSVRHMARAAP
ncbi:hypothetical protein IP88_13365 [alpha proteobacterium AAP81b]|nr:hypothetical protein IP88_13365 [alpha proteobacterium AAP81b]